MTLRTRFGFSRTQIRGLARRAREIWPNTWIRKIEQGSGGLWIAHLELPLTVRVSLEEMKRLAVLIGTDQLAFFSIRDPGYPGVPDTFVGIEARWA